MYKVLELFFDAPTKYFQLREISRIVKIGLPSVVNHVKRLEKEGLVKKEKVQVYNAYKANKNERFKLYKKLNMLMRLEESGLMEFLKEKCCPGVIVLFGSASRGEDIESSDIDLLMWAKEEKLELSKFEKKLKRMINLFFEEKLDKIPHEMMNNIINGVVLSGYLKVLK